MYSLVYVSSAVHPFTPPELRELMDRSHTNNAKIGITGMLLYRGGNFMQLLEGEKHRVIKLYEYIKLDPRHTGILTLLSTEESERMFPQWSMAYRDLSDPAVTQQPGFSEFLGNDLGARAFFENPTRAQRLLMHFKNSMR